MPFSRLLRSAIIPAILLCVAIAAYFSTRAVQGESYYRSMANAGMSWILSTEHAYFQKNGRVGSLDELIAFDPSLKLSPEHLDRQGIQYSIEINPDGGSLTIIATKRKWQWEKVFDWSVWDPNWNNGQGQG